MEEQGPAGIVANKLNQAALDAVQREIHADNLARQVRAATQQIENQKVDKFGGGFVELRRVKRDVQRCAGNARGRFASERDGPGNSGGLAEAASGGKATEPADGMTQSNRSGGSRPAW